MGTNLQQHLMKKEWHHGYERPPLGILITTKTSDEYFTVAAQFITFDPDDLKPRNLSHDQPLRDVVLNGQADRKRSEHRDDGHIYAGRLEVQSYGGGIDLPQMKRTTQAMSLIERRVEANRPKGEYGYNVELTWGEWFREVVHACGITQGHIVVYDGERRGWYTDSSFRPLSPIEAAEWVEQQALEAIK